MNHGHVYSVLANRHGFVFINQRAFTIHEWMSVFNT